LCVSVYLVLGFARWHGEVGKTNQVAFHRLDF